MEIRRFLMQVLYGPKNSKRRAGLLSLTLGQQFDEDDANPAF
jgi:hypothetical protein